MSKSRRVISLNYVSLFAKCKYKVSLLHASLTDHFRLALEFSHAVHRCLALGPQSSGSTNGSAHLWTTRYKYDLSAIQGVSFH